MWIEFVQERMEQTQLMLQLLGWLAQLCMSGQHGSHDVAGQLGQVFRERMS